MNPTQYAGDAQSGDAYAQRKLFTGAVEHKDISLLLAINTGTARLESLINQTMEGSGWLVDFRAKRAYSALTGLVAKAQERAPLYEALLSEIKPVTERLQEQIEKLDGSAIKVLPDSPRSIRQRTLLELNSRLLSSYTSRVPKIEMYVAATAQACEEAKAVCEFYEMQQQTKELSLSRLSKDLKRIVNSKQRIRGAMRELPSPGALPGVAGLGGVPAR